MARLEFNLWDARWGKLDGRRIVIETEAVLIEVTLPEGIELPDWGFSIYKVEDQGIQEEKQPEVCRHSPMLHRIMGGCVVSDCTCARRRADDPCDGSESLDMFKPKEVRS